MQNCDCGLTGGCKKCNSWVLKMSELEKEHQRLDDWKRRFDEDIERRNKILFSPTKIWRKKRKNKENMSQIEIKIHCQCPEKGEVTPESECYYSEEEKSGMNHEPNECRGTNKIKKYKRRNKELYLCSCCNLREDVELPPQ